MKTQFKKLITLMLVFSMVAVFMAGCSSGKKQETSQPAGQGQKEDVQMLKIVHLVPLTGGSAADGLHIADAAKMAVEEINNAGGFTGPNGEKIMIDYQQIDETSSSASAIEATKKAVSLQPHVILGPNRSGSILAAHQIWQDAKIPAITDGTNAQTTKQGNPYTFRMQISSEYWIPILVKTAVEQYNVKKPAILYGLNDYSKANYEATEPALEQYGLKAVTVQTFNDGDQDFSAQLIAIKNAGADAIFVYAYPAEAGRIYAQRVELGMGDIKIFTERASTNPATVQLAGVENYEGVVTSTTLSPGDPDPKVQEFIKKYEQKFAREISATHVNHYDSVYIVKSIVEKVGLDREKIREELTKLDNFEGALGVYSCDKEGNLVHHMYAQVFKDGKWELLIKETYPVEK